MTKAAIDHAPTANSRNALTTFKSAAKSYARKVHSSASNAVSDTAHGFFEITHNGFALLGLGLVFAMITLTARPDLRQAGENQLISWLEERRDASLEYVEPAAIDRATAAEPKDLPKSQAAVAYWLARKYGVAPEPLSVLVSEAFEIGVKAKLDPLLILAIMAIESGFNPFAQSPVGAQGLMQVMTRVHTDKYESFGGKLAAFDPVTNLRVGVKVLQECIAKAGSIEGGLKFYVGAGNNPDDGGYASKVMAEHARLQAVVGGKQPLTQAQMQTPTQQPTQQQPSHTVPVKLTAPADGDVKADEVVASLTLAL